MTLVRNDEEFCKMIDELVCLSENDQELHDGIAWLDKKSKELGISFYDMFFLVLQRHVAGEKAKEWLAKK